MRTSVKASAVGKISALGHKRIFIRERNISAFGLKSGLAMFVTDRSRSNLARGRPLLPHEVHIEALPQSRLGRVKGKEPDNRPRSF